MLLLVNQTVVDLGCHGLGRVDRKQVKIDKLCLAKHQLDVPVFVGLVCCAHRAMQQIAAILRAENLHVDQACVCL